MSLSADPSSPPLRLLSGASLDLRLLSLPIATEPLLELSARPRRMQQALARLTSRHDPPVAPCPVTPKTPFNTH